MKQAVIDASVAVDWLVEGSVQQEVFEFDELLAPTHFDAEVANGLRRIWLAQALDDQKFVTQALRIPRLPVSRHEWLHLLPRMLELSASITMYDAAYVALAEAHKVPLITSDARLSRAPGTRCAFMVLSL
jgi:predicted nucleic acid-binding protein